jgi:hypothetical protein
MFAKKIETMSVISIVENMGTMSGSSGKMARTSGKHASRHRIHRENQREKS